MRTRLRRAGLVLLLVLGCGLVAASLIAVYVRATVLNTDRYVETMAPIAESPDVQRAVAAKLDAAIASRVDYGALMQQALSDRGAGIAPALADSLRGAVRSQLDRLVASDGFQRLWEESNRRAHAFVVELLTGEGERVQLEDDTVVLDLSDAVERVRTGLEERDLERIAAAIPPTVDGRVPLLKSEGLAKARRAVDVLESLTIVLPILALLCLAGHVVLSRPKRRGLLRVGIALMVTALLLLALAGLGRSAYLDAIDREVLPRAAAADIFDALFELLRTSLRVVVVVAVVLALLALVLGRAERLSLRGAAGRLSWVGEHRGLLQGAAIALGALVLFAWDPPTARVVLIDVALVAAAVALIAAIAAITPASVAPGGAPPAASGSSPSAP
jgi:hypothetical protein